jgi:catechol 2,3-dioxygenase-like lactoylglutathione lyase family enzyme
MVFTALQMAMGVQIMKRREIGMNRWMHYGFLILALASVLSRVGGIRGDSFDAQSAETPQTVVPDEPAHGKFTGEILPVFYVTDVLRSVKFYREVLGFTFHHFFDYGAGAQVKEWVKDEPPTWALMSAGGFEFGLHRAPKPEEFRVGGIRHYFLVEDVDVHHRWVRDRGGNPGPLVDRSWMRMFRVVDPDGHDIWFGSRPE